MITSLELSEVKDTYQLVHTLLITSTTCTLLNAWTQSMHIKLLLYPFLSSTVSNSVKILTVVHFCATVARKYMHSNCSLVHIQMLKLPTTKHSVHSEATYIFEE